MQTVERTPMTRAERVFAAVMGWDLTHVVGRLVKEKVGTQEAAEEMVAEYRKFMIVALENPGKECTPSQIVDEVWHAHILYTQDYSHFSEELQGRFIHHNPASPTGEDLPRMQANYQNTRRLIKERFGSISKLYWPVGVKAAACGCTCCNGGCTADQKAMANCGGGCDGGAACSCGTCCSGGGTG